MRNVNTEITLIWILAVLVGALLYHFFLGRRGKISAEWETRYQTVEKELQEERARHNKMKSQVEAAVSKANSFSSAAHEVEKLKTKIHDLQKESENASLQAGKLRSDLAAEHSKVTNLMVDHGEVEEMKNRIRNQEKELSGIKSDAQKFKAELDIALSERAKLAAALNESQVNEMKNKIQRLENDLHSSRMLVAKFQTEANAVADEKKKVQAESSQVEQHKKDAESLRLKLGAVENDLQKARQGLSELNQLRTEVQNLKSEKDKWEDEANAQARNASDAIQLGEKISRLEHQLKTTTEEKAKIEKGSGEVLHLKEEQGQLRSKIALLESELLASKQAYEELEEKYEKSQNEKSSFSGQLKAESLEPTASEPQIGKPDNLKRIEGIGPKLEDLLYENNIYTFQQLADLSVEKIQNILDEAGEQYRIHDPGTWPVQAKLLAEGKFEEFEKLTLELKAGRKVE